MNIVPPKFSKNQLQDFQFAQSLEWLETNGIGGYASGTVSGAHSRSYHGLLVAALHPPVARTVLVSKVEESITLPSKDGIERFDLSSNQYPGSIYPEGYQHLVNFERSLFPVFYFEAGGVKLKKTIAAIQGENTTLVLYEVLQASNQFTLGLLPLYAARDFYSLSHHNDYINKQHCIADDALRIKNYADLPEVFIKVPNATFEESQQWYYNFEYGIEHERGLGYQEDLYTHGKFSIDLKKGDKVGVILSTEDTNGRDAFDLFTIERERREELIQRARTPVHAQLILAADQFIVARDGDLKTVLAGYHWFSDWGRDTMIALPGLCLTTGRFDDARKILQTFAEHVSEGMIPNRFVERGHAPEYNTIDASLWFFQAIYKYYQYARDQKFIDAILPVLLDIIEWHYKGTRYGIRVDDDALLKGGQDGVQLTWMDAKVGDWVVTPRQGKVVEINALWFNALCIVSYLLEETGNREAATTYSVKSRQVKESFNTTFWNEDKQCLYDYVNGEVKNSAVRPNQLYAISLPFVIVEKRQAEKILAKVTAELLTDRGIRSLSPADKDYKPFYEGDIWSRDGAYHQGTVWGFLMGAYIDALMHVAGAAGKRKAESLLTSFLEHLEEAGVGTLSEIFDGEQPHAPRGCMAQAWSVGEVLRVLEQHQLFVVKDATTVRVAKIAAALKDRVRY